MPPLELLKEIAPLIFATVHQGKFDCVECQTEVHAWSGVRDYFKWGWLNKRPRSAHPGHKRGALTTGACETPLPSGANSGARLGSSDPMILKRADLATPKGVR